eukprot:TRINITY_DN1982_c0_g1_i5.p1 TRINITY_DN1982_c0_g1~~TRINITY_DN1982_c0_g1_i5.p1  ORF type:complete len:1544 (-),score=250.30 TRINITY_DN1982_c0_g1_i5:66-4571(-)
MDDISNPLFRKEITHRGKIQNKNTCHALAFSGTVGIGDPRVTFKAGNYETMIFHEKSADSAMNNDFSLAICCTDLSAYAGNDWDGSFSLEFEFSSGIIVTFLVGEDTSALPLSTFYTIVPVAMYCDGVQVNCSNSDCFLNVLVSDDPLTAFLSAFQIRDLPQDFEILVFAPPQLKEISTLVWVTRFPDKNIQVAAANFGVGQHILDSQGDLKSTCRIAYDWLADEDGMVDTTEIIHEKFEPECTYQSFKANSEYFDSMVSVLEGKISSVMNLDFTHTFDFLEIISIIPYSRAWQACLRDARSLLTSEDETILIQDELCLFGEGTEEWDLDPCCNVVLRNSQCCITIEYSFQNTIYTVGLENIDHCAHPDCIRGALQVVADQTYEHSRSCSDPSKEARMDPKLTVNPWDGCMARTINPVFCAIDAVCTATVGKDSRCNTFGVAFCTVPCEPQVGCFLGVCSNDPTFGWICQDNSSNDDEKFNAFSECLLTSIDQYVAEGIKERILQASTSHSKFTFERNFKDFLETEHCLDHRGQPWPIGDHEWTKDECLNLKGTCPIWYCNMDLDPGCEELCLGPGPFQDGVCYEDVSSINVALPISRPNMCEVRVKDTGGSLFSQTLCNDLGGTFLPFTATPIRQFGSCLKYFDPSAKATETDCYVDSCIPNMKNDGVACYSYCKDESITNEALCTGSTSSGYTRKWYTWTDFATHTSSLSACVLEGEGKNYQTCLDEIATWIPGFDFLPEIWNSKDECDAGWCYERSAYGAIYGLDKDHCDMSFCTTCKTGYDAWCWDKDLCESKMTCLGIEGCLLDEKKWNAITHRADEQVVWTPKGYIAPLTTRADCDTSLDHVIGWLEAITDEAECANFAHLCNGGTVADARTSTHLPEGYTFREDADCIKCGGEPEPFFAWGTGNFEVWRQYRYSAKWRQVNQTIRKPVWQKRLNPQKWADLLELGAYSRYNVILVNEILCSSGAIKEALGQISCSCASGNGNDTCAGALSTLSGQSTGYFGVCKNSPSSQIISSLVIVNATEEFSVEDQASNCVAFEVLVVPFEQFEYNSKRHLTNLAIYSETSIKKSKSIYVYNNNGVVVGQIMGDGLRLDSDLNGNITGLQACGYFVPESATWSLKSANHSWGIVAAELSHKTFHMVELDSNWCLPLVHKNYTYFSARFVENHKDLIIADTWSSPELGLMIFIAVMYTLLTFWLCYSLLGRLIQMARDSSGFVIPLGLALILFQSIVRSIYFIGAPTGVFDYEYLAILFSDLPQVLFHGAVVTTGVLWYHIVSQAREKEKNTYFNTISYLYVASLLMFFIGLNVAVGALSGDEGEPFTCAHSEEERQSLSSVEIILFTYKAIFALYTILIAITFAVQSYRIVKLLSLSASSTEGTTNTIQKKRDTMGRLATEFGITSTLSVIGLLVQAAVCIYTAVDDLSNTEKMAIIITCELLPTYGLAYLFRFVSPWAAARKWINTSTSKSKSKSKSKSISKTGRTTGSRSDPDEIAAKK